MDIVLGSEADGMKPGRHVNSSLQKNVHSPSVGSLWGGRGKAVGTKNLPPTVESSEITALTDLGSLIVHLAKCREGIDSAMTHSPSQRDFLQAQAFMEQLRNVPDGVRHRGQGKRK